MSIAPASFLDPSLLASISNLEFLARTVVDGFMHGAHRSALKGSSLDFAEHRQYQPGDDLRRVDWKLFARTDKWYIKQYEADTNASVWFVMDVSKSMDYTSAKISKFSYASFLIASLAWLSKSQGDKVGFVSLGDDLGNIIPPSARHLQRVLLEISRLKPKGSGRLSSLIEKVAHVTSRSGIVVIVSDCYDEPDNILRSLSTVASRGHEIILFHIADRFEIDLSFNEPLTLEDSETGRLLPLRPADLRKKYISTFSKHSLDLSNKLSAAGMDYVRVVTDEPLDGSLHSYLTSRTMRHIRR